MENEFIEVSDGEDVIIGGNPDAVTVVDAPIPSSISVPDLEPIHEPNPMPEPEPIPTPSIPLGQEDEIYNLEEEKEEDVLGSCDCRSECKYNTGDASKRMNYGYSD